jgi:hypothetical protein
LTPLLKQAELVRTDTLAAAVELVRTGGAHARAGPRPALLAESVRLPGSVSWLTALPSHLTRRWCRRVTPGGSPTSASLSKRRRRQDW